MERFWKKFWKLFGAALLAVFAVGIIVGIVKNSSEFVYSILQQTVAVGLGVCGVIGFVVVPIEMYFEDRKQRRAGRAAE